jgi:cyclase
MRVADTPSAPHSRGRNLRLIARLDLKMDRLIKGVQFEGWRKLGDPGEFARRYYEDGADELIFMDVVASLYERNNLTDIVRSAAEDVLIPITVGGGIRSVADVKSLLDVGADKVAVNTGATRDPRLITSISDTYGAQAMVLSIEAKARGSGGWEAMTDNGRNHTGRDVVEWATEAVSRGAGEILLMSVDRDGTGRGPDVALIEAVAGEVPVPVIACGGVRSTSHIIDAATSGASAVAMARALHFQELSFIDARQELRVAGFRVRSPELS